MLELLAEVHHEACRALPELTAEVEDPTGRDALLLYTTLIELVGAVVALHRADNLTGVAAVARSALDAFVDIRNLLRDPEYWRHLEMPDNAEWRKIVQEASAGGNPFLDGLTNDPEFAKARKTFKERAKMFEANGAAKLTAEDRFKRALLSVEYASLYALLSSEVHNNISALITRHLAHDGTKWVLDLYSGRTGFGHAVLLSLAEMIMHSSQDMHVRFGRGPEAVARITAAVEQARADVKVKHTETPAAS